jgi:hypothetical protein
MMPPCALSAFCKQLLADWLSAMSAGCAWVEQPSSRFDNHAAAARAGMFETGWLPDWLPASATDIREKHDIDHGATILRFAFEAGTDSPPFDAACVPREHKHMLHPRLDAVWWPDTSELLAMRGLYECRKDSGFLAIPAAGGTAYFWRISV